RSEPPVLPRTLAALCAVIATQSADVAVPRADMAAFRTDTEPLRAVAALLHVPVTEAAGTSKSPAGAFRRTRCGLPGIPRSCRTSASRFPRAPEFPSVRRARH